MPRNPTTGVFTRVANSFSNPVYGTVIDPTGADALFDDYDLGITDTPDSPASSTDNAIARFDGVTGKFLQDSPYVTIDDNGTLATTLTGLTGNFPSGTGTTKSINALVQETYTIDQPGFYQPYILQATSQSGGTGNRNCLNVTQRAIDSNYIDNICGAQITGWNTGGGGGHFFGVNAYVEIDSGAVSADTEAVGIECDTDIRTDVVRKVGSQVVDMANSTGRGTTIDAAYWVAKATGGRGYEIGLGFGHSTGSYGLVSTGTVIKLPASVTIGSIIDLTSVTISDNIIKATNYNLTGAGAINAASYMRLGSMSAPNNTTAGDLTISRLSIGNTAIPSNVISSYSTSSASATSAGSYYGHIATLNYAPAASGSSTTQSLRQDAIAVSSSVSNDLGTLITDQVFTQFNGAGSVTLAKAASFVGLKQGSTGVNFGTITKIAGASLQGYDGTSATATGTITSVFGAVIEENVLGGQAPVGTAGLAISEQSIGTNNTDLLIGTQTIPSGSYALYSASTRASQLGGALTVNGVLTSSVANTTFQALFAGTTKGIRVVTGTSLASLDACDNTGAGYQQLRLSGSSLNFAISGTTKASISAAGSILLGTAAIATNATDGFVYIPTCAGTPTGTPTSVTGMVPMVWDSTNKKFYIYDGGWKGGTAPGVWS